MQGSIALQLFTLALIIQLNFSKVQAQVCPFVVISMPSVPDDTNGTIFDQPLNGIVAVDISISNTTFNRILEPKIELNRIQLLTKQPEFANILDKEGYAFLNTEGSDGVIITLDDDSTVTCNIILGITDTNNQPPVFSKTEKLDFNVLSSWDKNLALNWDFGSALQVTDQDDSDVNAKVIIKENENIRGEVKLRSKDQTPPNSFMYDVQLFINTDVPTSGVYTVTASDGKNEASLEVEIIVTQENLHDPVFRQTGYHYVYENMPQDGNEIPLEITAFDPDTTDDSTVIFYSVAANDYIDYSIETGKLFFKKVEGLEGKEEFTITATEENEDARSTDVKLSLTFPIPSLEELKFKAPYYIRDYEDWPNADEIIMASLDGEVQGTGDETFFYTPGPNMPSFIAIDGQELKFSEDVGEESELRKNRIVVFELMVTTTPTERTAYATFVITFPLTITTTTTPPESTTPCECPTPSTTEASTECPPPTTPEICPSTPEDCDCESSSTTEPPDGSTCPPPTDCPPTTTPEICPSTPEDCDCESSSTTEPPDGSTCPPPTDCPPTTTPEICPTTPEDCSCENCPTSSPITCPPTTTGEPCSPCPTTCPTCPATTTTTLTTCPPCITSTTPSTGTCAPCPTTCPTCPTTTTLEPCECEGEPSTCAPCDCNETTTTCRPCPCDQDGDGEDDDCSNTGLLVAVIVTSILCAASICAAGYLIWLLRKASIDPARMQRDNSFLIPKSNSINDLYKPDTSAPTDNFRFGNENSRMSFGGGMSTLPGTNPVEPGITNPSFSMDKPEPAARRFSVPKTNLPPSTTPTPAPTVTPTVVPPVDNSSIYSQPVKKSNIKSPKEIEPDYEERPVQKSPERKLSVKRESNAHIKFAPEDEYISIDKDEAPSGGGGDGGTTNVDLDNDSEYERL